MKNILKKFTKNSHRDGDRIERIAKKELKENKAVIESLRDYDAGKKDIPTRDIERRLPNIRVAS